MDMARNMTFMFYGFLAAWLIVLLYVFSLRAAGSAFEEGIRGREAVGERGGCGKCAARGSVPGGINAICHRP